MPKLAETTRVARRGQLLRAAAECFARSGYHATTMSDIALQAGVSKGAPYLYFPSKEALYVGLNAEWRCVVGERVAAAVAALPEAQQRSPRRVLWTVVAAIGRHVSSDATTCRVLMEAYTLAAYHPAIAAAVAESTTTTQASLERLIRAGIDAGEWPADTDPVLQTRLITAVLHGLMAHWHLTPGSFSWDDAATAIANPHPPATGREPHD